MAIYFINHSFGRIHQTLRVTPAMAAGIKDKLWDLEDMAALLDKQAPAKRGPYHEEGCVVELLIRPYAETDFEVVTEIWFTSWISTRVGGPDLALRAELRERLPREIANGWSVHVGTLGTEIVGFLALRENELEQLFIAPAMQGQGMGKRLLDFAKVQRPTGFYLTTPTEGRACRFYEREGLCRGESGVHPQRGHPIVRCDWRP